jgi:hypothetical protein
LNAGGGSNAGGSRARGGASNAGGGTNAGGGANAGGGTGAGGSRAGAGETAIVAAKGSALRGSGDAFGLGAITTVRAVTTEGVAIDGASDAGCASEPDASAGAVCGSGTGAGDGSAGAATSGCAAAGSRVAVAGDALPATARNWLELGRGGSAAGNGLGVIPRAGLCAAACCAAGLGCDAGGGTAATSALGVGGLGATSVLGVGALGATSVLGVGALGAASALGAGGLGAASALGVGGLDAGSCFSDPPERTAGSAAPVPSITIGALQCLQRSDTFFPAMRRVYTSSEIEI